MTKDRDRIQHYEDSFNHLSETVTDFEQVLDRLEQHLPAYRGLLDYYNSPQWLADKDWSEQADFPQISCGVLSEDGVYSQLERLGELVVGYQELMNNLNKETSKEQL